MKIKQHEDKKNTDLLVIVLKNECPLLIVLVFV
jgi:hypothetical protein